MKIDTQLIHAGELRPRPAGAVVAPIFQSSTFEYGGQSDYHDIHYIRLNNTPNHLALHAKLAALEGAEAGLVAASGMAAISSTLLGLLSAGDHLLAHSTLYGGTHHLVNHDLGPLGISTSFVDADAPDTWHRALTKTSRVFYVESMTNPLLEVVDLEAVVAFARQHDLVTVIDNTFATPVNFRPVAMGFDLVVHSATKYLNGHSDIVAGAVVGRANLVERVKKKLDHFGGSLDPHACFLLQRGLKTLALRMRHQNDSASRLASALSGTAGVEQVHYPALASHPRHARATRLFSGMGGVLSFTLSGGVAAAQELVRGLELAVSAPSLGGPETLVTLPATTSHAGMSADERAKAGIADGLVRVSVGLEDPGDLVADFTQALAR
jgi:cystathionine beta-lyase/cystathionine gamma-synthase